MCHEEAGDRIFGAGRVPDLLESSFVVGEVCASRTSRDSHEATAADPDTV